MVYARLAADADQFLTLAKFRRCGCCGRGSSRPAALAKTACLSQPIRVRMLTQRDAYVNMLRATMATFSAGLGGANAIAVLRAYAGFGVTRSFARRAARNTQLCGWKNPTSPSFRSSRRRSGHRNIEKQLCESHGRCFRRSKRPADPSPRSSEPDPAQSGHDTKPRARPILPNARNVLTAPSEFPNLHEAEIAVLDR